MPSQRRAAALGHFQGKRVVVFLPECVGKMKVERSRDRRTRKCSGEPVRTRWGSLTGRMVSVDEVRPTPPTPFYRAHAPARLVPAAIPFRNQAISVAGILRFVPKYTLLPGFSKSSAFPGRCIHRWKPVQWKDSSCPARMSMLREGCECGQIQDSTRQFPSP